MKKMRKKLFLTQDLNPGPLDPFARTLPLDQNAMLSKSGKKWASYRKKIFCISAGRRWIEKLRTRAERSWKGGYRNAVRCFGALFLVAYTYDCLMFSIVNLP